MFWILLGTSLVILPAALIGAYDILVNSPLRSLEPVGDTHKLCVLCLTRYNTGYTPCLVNYPLRSLEPVGDTREPCVLDLTAHLLLNFLLLQRHMIDTES